MFRFVKFLMVVLTLTQKVSFSNQFLEHLINKFIIQPTVGDKDLTFECSNRCIDYYCAKHHSIQDANPFVSEKHLIEIQEKMYSCLQFCPLIQSLNENPSVAPHLTHNISLAEYEKRLNSYKESLDFKNGVMCCTNGDECENCTPYIMLAKITE